MIVESDSSEGNAPSLEEAGLAEIKLELAEIKQMLQLLLRQNTGTTSKRRRRRNVVVPEPEDVTDNERDWVDRVAHRKGI